MKIKKIILQISSFSFLLVFLILGWIYLSQFSSKQKNILRSYLPEASDAILEVNIPTLLNEGALLPLFNDDLDEEKRKIVFQKEDAVKNSGIALQQPIYLTLENKDAGEMYLLFLNLSNAAQYKIYSKANNWITAYNNEMAVIAYSDDFSKEVVQAYVTSIVAKKVKAVYPKGLGLLSDSVLAQITFPKSKRITKIYWDKTNNKLDIHGELPTFRVACKQKLKNDSEAFYAAFPVGQLFSFLPQSLCDELSLEWLEAIDFTEMNYYGSEVDIQKQSVNPKAALAIHFNSLSKDEIIAWMSSNPYLTIQNDSLLLINNTIPAHYVIDSTILYVFNKSVKTTSTSELISFQTLGDASILFNFYNNSLVNFLIAGQPALKELKVLLNAVDKQQIRIENKGTYQSINGEVYFENSFNVPFELAYLARLLEAKE